MASITNVIKVEDGSSPDPFCFICLEQVSPTNCEKFNSLNFFLKYLRIRDKVTRVPCDKCENHLMKFERLSNILEKVRLEMDYLLDCIQSKIYNSNGVKLAPIEFAFVRKTVVKKCKEKMYNPKLKILLERVNLSTPVKSETLTPDFEDDWSPNSDNNYDDQSTSSDSDTSESAAIPVGKIKNIKSEINSETLAPICNEESFAPKATKKRVKCTKCAKTFNRKAALKVHNRDVHLRLKPFKCSTCEKRFSQTGHLKRHVEAVHLRFYPYKCKCDICGKSFTTARNLRTHEALHNKPKPHIPIEKMVSCKKCGKAFDNSKTLKYHMYNVHPVNKHPCHICKRMFNARTNLYKHIADLHDKRRYCCQAGCCDKSYSQERYLVQHYRKNHPDFTFTIARKTDYYSLSDKFKVISESRNKRVECVICRKHFKTVKTVKYHLQTIHRLMKFKCKFCGYETKSKASFEDHIKQKHDTPRLVDNKENPATLDGESMNIKSEIKI